MKYDAQVSALTPVVSGAQNVLIALPTEVTSDLLASGLALYLSLEQAGKKVAVVTEGTIRVGHTNLFGVGKITNTLPATSGGNFTISLGGVVAKDANGQPTVPALEKLDWSPQGSDLKLVFHVLPGQKFEPTFVTPSVEGGKFDLIFVLGAQSLANLGGIYNNNQTVFSGTQLINIDRNGQNSQFGTTNIVDFEASSLSEIIGQLLPALALPFNQDIASNVLTGIFEATSSLQSGNVNVQTYEVVANALKVGGQKPTIIPTPQAVPTPEPTTIPFPSTPTSQPQTGFDISKILGAPPAPIESGPAAPSETFTVPPVVSPGVEQKTASQPAENTPTPSSEETPQGEQAQSQTPEADWLTPKIFKSGSIG